MQRMTTSLLQTLISIPFCDLSIYRLYQHLANIRPKLDVISTFTVDKSLVGGVLGIKFHVSGVKHKNFLQIISIEKYKYILIFY
jgi:hypothetical protein